MVARPTTASVPLPRRMRILITGREGQLGWALARQAAGIGTTVALGRAELDLADPTAIASAVARLKPDVVLNAAAYTAVDRAETDVDSAFRINVDAPAAFAAACAAAGAVLIHYSTDYVFDGARDGSYDESVATNPLNIYGKSKRAGEVAVLGSRCAALVLRTSWLYGEHGGNFAKTMLRIATEREQLRVVGDQWGAPTWATRLAEATCRILALARDSSDRVGWAMARRGLYHASASGRTTWAEYARCVIGAAAHDPNFAPRMKALPEDVVAIPSAEYPTAAQRPANSLLDCSKFAAAFDYRFPDWRGDVEQCVAALLRQTNG
jgi:dTDP-4-dehydrorhamnose reductase